MTSHTEEIWSLFDSFVEPTDKREKGDGVCSNNAFMCSQCKTDDVTLEDGNYICKLCGDVVERFIDSGAEWRFYGCDDSRGNDPTRCGLPTSDLLPESSMGALIGYGVKETHELRLMRRYHLWNSMTYKERTLYNIFDTLTIAAVNNGINKSIIDEAKMLYKKLSEMKISRGENRSGLIASSIYMACKRNNVPRSAKEIAAIFNLKVTTMTKGCKRFQELMKMSMNATGPADFIARFCSRLDLDSHMRDFCKDVIRKADELSVICENTPPSVAAGAIYMCNVICGWGISKQVLSKTCEISQVTITKCFNKFMEHRHVLIPENVLQNSQYLALKMSSKKQGSKK